MAGEAKPMGGLRDLFAAAEQTADVSYSPPPVVPVASAPIRLDIPPLREPRPRTVGPRAKTSLRVPASLLQTIRDRRWGHRPLTVTGLLETGVAKAAGRDAAAARRALDVYRDDQLVGRAIELGVATLDALDHVAADWQMSRSRAATAVLHEALKNES